MVRLGVLTQVGVADKNFPTSCASKFMGVPNMIVTIFLLYNALQALQSFTKLYKAFFTLGVHDFLVSSVYMHITLGYVLKIPITVFTHHLAVLAISFQCRWIFGYLTFCYNWLRCDCGVFEVHMVQKHFLVYQVLLTHLALAV